MEPLFQAEPLAGLILPQVIPVVVEPRVKQAVEPRTVLLQAVMPEADRLTGSRADRPLSNPLTQ